MRKLTGVAVAAITPLLLVASGCSGGQPVVSGGSNGTASTVTVFAAASMKTTFTKLGKAFEAGHPGVTVAFNFAGSQTLADQITQGAPADVFASANEASVATVTAANLNAAPARLYATNTLIIAVPPGNPAKVTAFKDLARPGLKVVVCAPAVPCGAATVRIEQATGVTLTPVSEEPAVSDVLSKVAAGEADAGLVYKTDVIAAGDRVLGVAFPEAAKAINNNSIVALKAGPQAALGQQFVELVLSGDGRTVLAGAGFGATG